MKETNLWRGHLIFLSDGVWLYTEDQTPVASDPDRACGYCDIPNTYQGYDGCLGELSGVSNACCGHGVKEEAYVQIGAERLAGDDALDFFRKNRKIS